MVFKKGDPKPPGSGMQKGMKIRPTLLREERRAIFDAEISQVFEEKIQAARPEYVLDQYLGKPAETHVNVNIDATERARELANKLIRLH